MQNDRLHETTYGGGIYESNNERTAEKEDDQLLSIREEQIQSPKTTHDPNHNVIHLDSSKLVTNDKFESILSVLDQQVQYLDELRQINNNNTSKFNASETSLAKTEAHVTTNNSNLESENILCKSTCTISENDDYDYDYEQEFSKIDRQSLLDRYIRNNISNSANGGTDCGCHFNFRSNELKLLNELNECYRRFCQTNSREQSTNCSDYRWSNQAQQVIGEKFNFIERREGSSRTSSSETERNSHYRSNASKASSTVANSKFDTQPQQEPILSSSDGRNYSSSLFIDNHSAHTRDGRQLNGTGTECCRGIDDQLALSSSTKESGPEQHSSKSDRLYPFCTRTCCKGSSSGQKPGDKLTIEPHAADSRDSSGSIGSGSGSKRDEQSTFVCNCERHFKSKQQAVFIESDSSDAGQVDDDLESNFDTQSVLESAEESPACEPSQVGGFPFDSESRLGEHRPAPGGLHQEQYSTSSTESGIADRRNCFEYQLGCSLTNDSTASLACSSHQQSPIEYSPSLDHRQSLEDIKFVASSDNASDDRLSELVEEHHINCACIRHDSDSLLVPSTSLTNESNSTNDPQRESETKYGHSKYYTNELSESQNLSCPDPDASEPSSPLKMEPNEATNSGNYGKRGSKAKRKAGSRVNDKTITSSSDANKPAAVTSRAGAKQESTKRDIAASRKPLATDDDKDSDAVIKRPKQESKILREKQRESLFDSSPKNLVKDDSTSMRAAKDIAKLSIPSLSALQYLPGQMDVRGAKSVDSFASDRSASNSVDKSTRSTMVKQIDESRLTITDSKERKRPDKHDDSCLFHRLCLCNCMHVKKSKSSPADEATRETLSPSPSSSQSSSARDSKASGRNNKNVIKVDSPRSSSSSRLSSRGSNDDTKNVTDVDLSERGSRLHSRASNISSGLDSTVELSETLAAVSQSHDKRRREKRRLGEEYEKQSPTFMSLLDPSRHSRSSRYGGSGGGGVGGFKGARKSKPEKYEDNRSLGLASFALNTKLLSRPKQKNLTAISSDGLGSIGDLAISGRSSASDSHTSEPLCSPLSRQSKPRNSDRSTGRHRRSPEILSDDSCYLEVTDNQASTVKCESSSSCSNPLHNKRLASYKRFLSPRKLFYSSASSICDCDTSKQNETVPQQSFLSRSLIRLSRRKQPRRISLSEQLYSEQSANQPTSSECASPTVSISNNSQPDTYSDSINSINDTSLSQSLPFNVNDGILNEQRRTDKNSTRLSRVPDIVLSRVEYQDAEKNNHANDMTRSINGHHSYRSSSAQFNRSHQDQLNGHHHHNNHSTLIHRHGSEYSFDASDNSGSYSQQQGPFSLPGSPRPHRHSNNINRSPRLSQSPVPFQSPATESTKIEDGLKVCSTEHFEKHIGNINRDQVEAQKKLFTAWINHIAPNLIRHDLFVELQDGIKLIGLLATLTHDQHLLAQYERLNRDKQSYINRLVLTPSSRLKHLSNVSIAIDYLRKNLGMRLVNLNPMDVVSGKANVILGLCWSIILHFQFDQNFFKSSDSSSNHSSINSHCTSRFSSDNTNEDGAKLSCNQVMEFTTKDLTNARKRILEHINKRFSLKLTNLTSSLVDGDVLLAIIKNLLPPNIKINQSNDSIVYNSKTYELLTDDEKLDYCFQLAKDYLNVPKLISAADLRQQTIDANNSRPLLVYLSMLLKANPHTCSTDQIIELRQLDESLNRGRKDDRQKVDEPQPAGDIDSIVASHLEDIESKRDNFHIEKLQSTLLKIKKLDELIGTNQQLMERHSKLKRQAEQVESLIDWINRADKLFNATQRSSSDLSKAIEEYQNFFSPTNLPHVDTTLCPTLERQYRECLATAKQRILSMEQTMKNWLSYDQARQDLKNWLIAAEAKLTEALRPGGNPGSTPDNDDQSNTVHQHMSRLDDLIEYFELEPIEMDDFDASNHPFATKSMNDIISSSSLSIEHSNRSLSGSLISLGSTGSRMSTLTSSKKAAYHRLFDNFELKCRLLAAMLEAEQRDALLLGVTDLKSRLKYTTEYKVPQVISEIRMSISRCEMSIKEQDEVCEDLEDSHNSSESYSGNANGNLLAETSPSSDIQSDDCVLVSDESSGLATKCNIEPEREKVNKKKRKNKTRQSNKARKNNGDTKKTGPLVKSINKTCQGKTIDFDDDDTPFFKKFWHKIVRASKMSLSFNIVLLICLAGICVVPLIQRDACCELSLKPVPSGEYSVSQRPT